MKAILVAFGCLACLTILLILGFVFILTLMRQRQLDAEKIPAAVRQAILDMGTSIIDTGWSIRSLITACQQLDIQLKAYPETELEKDVDQQLQQMIQTARGTYAQSCVRREPPLPEMNIHSEFLNDFTSHITDATTIVQSLTTRLVDILEQKLIDTGQPLPWLNENKNKNATNNNNDSNDDDSDDDGYEEAQAATEKAKEGLPLLYVNNVTITPALIRRLQIKVRERSKGFSDAMVEFERSLIDFAYAVDIGTLTQQLADHIEKESLRAVQLLDAMLYVIHQTEEDLVYWKVELGALASRQRKVKAAAPDAEVEDRVPFADVGAEERLHDIGEKLKDFQEREKLRHKLAETRQLVPKLAIVVPLRNREEHAALFLRVMRESFSRPAWSGRHAHIFFVEQVDHEPFNRAKLLNIGCLESSARGFNYFAFHDVDMVPLSDKVAYDHPKADPAHIATCVEQFGWNMPYGEYFGGVTIANLLHMQATNGYSNRYWGWGGEDDDFAKRVAAGGLGVTRRKPYCTYGAFRSLEEVNQNEKKQDSLRWEKLRFFAAMQPLDGLSTLTYELIDRQTFDDYTYIRAIL